MKWIDKVYVAMEKRSDVDTREGLERAKRAKVSTSIRRTKERLPTYQTSDTRKIKR